MDLTANSTSPNDLITLTINTDIIDYYEDLGNVTADSEYTHEEIKAFYYYNNIATAIWKYVPGFLICIGTIGNALSALVMTRPSLKKNVSSLFFTVLAFVDTFCLLTGLLRYWLLGLKDHDVRKNSDVSCKLHTFLVYWSADFSGWILVLVSVERCIAANLPHIYKQSCTRAKAAASLIVCAGLLVVLNCHLLFGLHLKVSVSNTTTTKSCINQNLTSHYHGFVFPWIDLIFFCLGPFLCILLCNISIIVKVLRSRAVTEQKSSNRMSSMTAILICVSIFYILCTAPVAVYLIYQNSWFKHAGLVFYGKMQVYWAVASILSYFNNSMNFFLYCVSGPRFRRELVRMFSCLKTSSLSRESSVSGL